MLDFYKGKKVFITGHTGFKGSWLTKILLLAGAEVTGYSLIPPTNSNLFNLSGVEGKINSIIGDIRDLVSLKKAIIEASPEIVFHLAAQPIVRESYNNPHYTYETNVMGTVNLFESIRESATVKSVVNVTTDKVYENKEWDWGYREIDTLNGYDPYSNSKSCSELITHSYRNSFFSNSNIRISTARAGNVIGGGDFSKDRIIPDCVKAVIEKKEIIVRNPNSIRPYQHVFEPLNAYLMIAEKQYCDDKYEGYYNIGPDEEDCVTTGKLVDMFCRKWGQDISWINKNANGPHEANYLKLDCSKMRRTFDWKPRSNVDYAIEKTIEWTKNYLENEDIPSVMDMQIKDFFTLPCKGDRSI